MSISIKKRLQPTYTYSPFPFKTLESFCFSDVSAYILSYLLFVPSLLLPIRKILVRQNSESQYEVESINDQSYLWKNGCYGNKRNSRDGPSLHLKLIEVVYLIILNVITGVDVHVIEQLNSVYNYTRILQFHSNVSGLSHIMNDLPLIGITGLLDTPLSLEYCMEVTLCFTNSHLISTTQSLQ